jgi:hypothetical protein
VSRLDDLLVGSYDLHCHVYPEVSLEQETRLDDIEQMAAAERAGVAGVVLKSHIWPTTSRAFYLGQRTRSLQIFSSIVLNQTSGGMDPLAVEAAARQGARVLFFPTWQTTNDLHRHGFSNVVNRRLPRYAPTIRGMAATQDGKLTSASLAVLEAAEEFDMLVCTGHLSAEEGMAVIRAARERGLRTVFTHPSSPVIGASVEQMQEASSIGAYVEFVCQTSVSLRPHVSRWDETELIRRVGPEHCCLSTDAFNPYVPSEPELLRLGVGQFVECGLSYVEVRSMISDNPRRALGL